MVMPLMCCTPRSLRCTVVYGIDDGVVLIRSHCGLPLRREDANDAKRLIVDAHRRAHGIRTGAKQLIASHRPKHGHLGGAHDFLRGEKAPELHWPRTNRGELFTGPLHLGIPVRGLRHDLRACIQRRRQVANPLHLAPQRFRIVVGQRRDRPLRPVAPGRSRRSRRSPLRCSSQRF